MSEKPEYLYRGITLNYDVLNKVKIDGVDIVPPYGYVSIDSNGRKIRSDGNEYGIYMTDKFDMADSKYGYPEINLGTLLANYPVSSYDNIRIPVVGVIYKIDTENLDTHRAFLSSVWGADRQHRGDEWISDIIPAQCYSVLKVVISKDILHDREEVVITDGMDITDIVRDIVEARKASLEIMINDLNKLSPIERKDLKLDFLRTMYGNDGARYVLFPNQIKITSNNDYIKFLMSSIYRSNMQQIDILSLKYIMSLKNRIVDLDVDNIEEIIQLVQKDLLNDKLSDKYRNLYDNILNILINKKLEKMDVPVGNVNVSSDSQDVPVKQKVVYPVGIKMDKSKVDEYERKKQELLRQKQEILNNNKTTWKIQYDEFGVEISRTNDDIVGFQHQFEQGNDTGRRR